ncbi:MAG: amidase, partial [Acidobacteriales bacterium]|nr:amidase [Terriglobales bacterium]
MPDAIYVRRLKRGPPNAAKIENSFNKLLGSLLQVAALLRRGKLTSLELTQDCLDRIARLNPILNAFITVTAESALARASEADAEIQAGHWRGPLHGIPLGIKDLIDTAGIRTTAASAVFKDRIPVEDAEVVRKLKVAGAVLLGKQNLHEFAYGGSSLISYFGAVRNPWNTAYIAGGSSGGSAAAVAADLCYGAVGTDTAGSIRQPAALCGIVGLKPSYGRVSLRGVIPLSPSLDHVGPIARSVEDAAVIFQAIAGLPNEPLQLPKQLRIGIPRAFFYEDLDPEIAEATTEALSVLTENGAQLHEITLSVPTDRALVRGEAYAFHPELIARSRGLYQPETLRRILDGEGITEEELQQKSLELEQSRREIKK